MVAGVAAGAGVLMLIVAGVVIYRRRGDTVVEDDSIDKYLQNAGHVTVAGDTYAASSLDSQSRTGRLPSEIGDIRRSGLAMHEVNLK